MIAHRVLTSVAAIPLLMVACSTAVSSDRNVDDFRPLFNGKDLTGWVPVNTAPSTWSVKDGMLICNGKPTGELRTDRMYQNFILEVEWRHMVTRGNAGIFVWADDITARGVPFHRSIEVQVLENAYGNTRGYTTHGDIFPIHGAKMTPVNGRGSSRAFPTEERSKPSPEWNHYQITCQDGAVTLAVNGKVVTQGRDCSPRKGYICIESEGGVVHYRNLKLRELPDTPVKLEDVAIPNRGYRSLYSGVDLSGWKVANGQSGQWKSNDWVLSYGATADAPADRGTLTTSDSLTDFGFIIDVRARKSPGTVTLQLRNSPAGNIDLLSNDSIAGGTVVRNQNWNRYEGALTGNTLTLSLNGEIVEKGRILDGAPADGPLGLVATGEIDIANVYIRPIESK